MYFSGQCPFLVCPVVEPHTHPVCPTCNTVNYGNIACVDCRSLRPQYDAWLAEQWILASKEAGR